MKLYETSTVSVVDREPTAYEHDFEVAVRTLSKDELIEVLAVLRRMFFNVPEVEFDRKEEGK